MPKRLTQIPDLSESLAAYQSQPFQADFWKQMALDIEGESEQEREMEKILSTTPFQMNKIFKGGWSENNLEKHL